MISVPVTETTQVAEARRCAAAVARRLGFGETATGRVALVATELATNLVKYARGGELLVGTYEHDFETGVELLALDRGGGLADAEAALADGRSTGGSAGLGLGTVRRQSQDFEVISSLGRGMAVLSRLAAARTRPPHPPVAAFGAVTVPLKGQLANGDAHCFRPREGGWTLMVADGLGHGTEAAKASGEAVGIFRDRDREGESAEAVVAAIHAGLRQTRGGAVSVARYDAARGAVSFCGLGNVAGTTVQGGTAHGTVVLAGTAGHNARRIQAFDYPLAAGGLFVLCSDGIGSGWSLADYPGLQEAHPALVAAVIYRDFGRARDDATVAVARALPAAALEARI